MNGHALINGIKVTHFGIVETCCEAETSQIYDEGWYVDWEEVGGVGQEPRVWGLAVRDSCDL